MFGVIENVGRQDEHSGNSKFVGRRSKDENFAKLCLLTKGVLQTTFLDRYERNAKDSASDYNHYNEASSMQNCPRANEESSQRHLTDPITLMYISLYEILKIMQKQWHI